MERFWNLIFVSVFSYMSMVTGYVGNDVWKDGGGRGGGQKVGGTLTIHMQLFRDGWRRHPDLTQPTSEAPQSNLGYTLFCSLKFPDGSCACWLEQREWQRLCSGGSRARSNDRAASSQRESHDTWQWCVWQGWVTGCDDGDGGEPLSGSLHQKPYAVSSSLPHQRPLASPITQLESKSEESWAASHSPTRVTNGSLVSARPARKCVWPSNGNYMALI